MSFEKHGSGVEPENPAEGSRKVEPDYLLAITPFKDRNALEAGFRRY